MPIHPLKAYLNALNESVADFSDRIGVSRQTLYRIMSGKQTPKPALARRIVEATGGDVDLHSLYTDSANSAAIMAFRASDESSSLDPRRLRTALAIVFNHVMADQESTIPDATLFIAEEAVSNTYAALQSITSRHGADRLAQALRPVIEEILRGYIADAPASMLDRAALLAAEIYLQFDG